MSEMMGGNEDEASKRMKRVAFIFDSMTTEELDSDGTMFRSRPRKARPSASKKAAVATTKGGKAAGGGDPSKRKTTAPKQDDGRPREPNRRVLRVARGSGTSVSEVEELLSQHQMFSGMVKKAGGKSGW